MQNNSLYFDLFSAFSNLTMLCQLQNSGRRQDEKPQKRCWAYQKDDWVPWHLRLVCLGLGTPPCPEKSCYDPSLVLCPNLAESPYLVDKVFETFGSSFACLQGHCCCAYCEQAIHFCERAKHEHCWGPSCVQTAPSCIFHSTAHRVHSESPSDPRKGELHSGQR